MQTQATGEHTVVCDVLSVNHCNVSPPGTAQSVYSGIIAMGWRKNFVPALLKIFKKKHLEITAQVCVCLSVRVYTCMCLCVVHIVCCVCVLRVCICVCIVFYPTTAINNIRLLNLCKASQHAVSSICTYSCFRCTQQPISNNQNLLMHTDTLTPLYKYMLLGDTRGLLIAIIGTTWSIWTMISLHIASTCEKSLWK